MYTAINIYNVNINNTLYKFIYVRYVANIQERNARFRYERL